MKKKIAMIMAMALTLTSMGSISAFAASPPVANQTGSGAGTVEAVDAIAYRVIVPTTIKLDYLVDPQGVATLDKGDKADVSDLEEVAGNVYAKDKLSIANRSSKDITVTATVTATDGEIKCVDDASDASVSDASIDLALVVSEATFTEATDGTEYDDAKAKATDAKKYEVDFTQATTGYALSNKTVAVPVTLAKAEYEISKDSAGTAAYTIKDGSIGGAVSFAIAGHCSSKGEFMKDNSGTKVVKTAPELAVTFAFADATDAEITALGDDNVKITEGSLTKVTGLAVDVTPATPATPALNDGDTFNDADGDIKVKLSDETTSITSLKLNYSGTMFEMDTDDYSFNESTGVFEFKVSSSWTGTNDLQYLTVLGGKEIEYTLTTNDGVIKFKVTYAAS